MRHCDEFFIGNRSFSDLKDPFILFLWMLAETRISGLPCFTVAGRLRKNIVELNKIIRLDGECLAVWRKRECCFTLRRQLDLSDSIPCCRVVNVHTPRSNMIADVKPTNAA